MKKTPTNQKNPESYTKDTLKEVQMRDPGNPLEQKKWESARIGDIQQPILPWCPHFSKYNTWRYNSLSQPGALSLFRTTLSTACQPSGMRVQSCSQSPVRCPTAGAGWFRSKELVHEMSREKKSYTVLSLLQNRSVDWQQTLYNNSFQADGEITICSSVAIFCCLSQATQLHDLPIRRVRAALCVFSNAHIKTYGLILWLVLVFHFVKLCLQHLTADGTQIIASAIHTKASRKFLHRPWQTILFRMFA